MRKLELSEYKKKLSMPTQLVGGETAISLQARLAPKFMFFTNIPF